MGVRWYFYEIEMWRCFWTLNALSVYSWSGCSHYCWNSASSLKGIYGSSKRWKIYRLRGAIQRLPITEMYLDRFWNTSNATDLITRNDMPNQRDPVSVADLITLGSNPPEYTKLAGYFSTARFTCNTIRFSSAPKNANIENTRTLRTDTGEWILTLGAQAHRCYLVSRKTYRLYSNFQTGQHEHNTEI